MGLRTGINKPCGGGEKGCWTLRKERASSRGRLDILLEQLGPNVVSETLEVELGALGRFQSGEVALEGGVLERMNALGLQMGMTVKWWDEELPLSDVGGGGFGGVHGGLGG